MKIEGHTVLLTGASGGIGQVIARVLYARGATLLVASRSKDKLERLCAKLGERAQPVLADLADPDQVARLAERAANVDILVAGAGLPASGPIDWFSSAEIDRAIQVNLHAPIQLARAMVPAMSARNEGHLVFVSSLLGRVTRPGAALYSATKFGVRGFGLALRDDLYQTGVGVSNVLPGLISDAGMYADTGVALPPGTPTSSAQDVADAVVRAIEDNEAEIVVAPIKLRLGSLIVTLAPGLGAKLMRRRNPAEQGELVARAQSSKR